MTLPRLYKKSKTEAIVITDIRTEGPKIIVTTGQLDGAKIDHETICEPKNVGKKNETTAEKQAELEAESKWRKKIKAGYVEDPSGEITRKLPMKVKIWQEHKHKYVYPHYISPKLNGVNGEYRLEDGELKLYSRGGDLYLMLEHQKEEVLKVMEFFDTKTLNGEIYKHGMHLQDITSAVKKHNKDTPSLEFHVFDIPDWEVPYEEKVEKLIQASKEFTGIVKVFPVYLVTTEEEVEEFQELFLAQGYEGSVIRRPGLIYKYNERSSDIFKYKIAQDAEYKIVGYRLDKKGHPVFTCVTEQGLEFAVKPKGTDEERLNIAKNADSWIGKWLKIEFEMLSKDKKPLKPVGIGLRECDKDGNPME